MNNVGHLRFLGGMVLLFCLALVLAGCESADNSDSSEDLAITPVAISVSAAAVTNISFKASGGTQPYAWSVNDTSIGWVVGADDTAVYTSYAITGLNFVVVTDANTNAVAATITQG